MGKRSRKRSGRPEGTASRPGAPEPSATPRAASGPRPQPRRGRRAPADAQGPAGRVSIDERPPPLWAPFPLTELVTLGRHRADGVGLSLRRRRTGNRRLVAGLAIASLAGLELAVREHVTGLSLAHHAAGGRSSRSWSWWARARPRLNPLGLVLVAGLVAFAAAFYWLRGLFKGSPAG